jgi:uncharacterized protein YjiS (DUF1127 family)
MEQAMNDCIIYGQRFRNPRAHALATILAGLIAATWRGIGRCIASIGQWNRRARAREELRSLSDRTLRDIGIERGQIERLFR